MNVAGILRDRMIFNMTIEEWDAVIRGSSRGHFCTMRPASAHMRERKFGRIIKLLCRTRRWALRVSPTTPRPRPVFSDSLSARANSLHKYGITVQRDHAQARDPDDRHDSARDAAGYRPASEAAAGTAMDPANVTPIIVFLASDEGGRRSTANVSAPSGYRITRYTHIEPDRVLCSNGPWDIDQLFKIFKSTLGPGCGRRECSSRSHGHGDANALSIRDQSVLREGAQDSRLQGTRTTA